MQRVSLGDIHATPSTFDEAIETILKLARQSRPALVVTPNIAHVWQAQSNESLREAYDRASFSPSDGWPVVKAINILAPGSAVERVPGSDLLTALCRLDVSVSLIGGKGDSAHYAAKNLKDQNPSLNVANIESAPYQELTDPDLRNKMRQRIASSDAEIIFVGLGVPKQEALALELLDTLSHGVIICVGASIEFAAGILPRAPEWMRQSRLEWLYRLVKEPRKMFPRYFMATPFFIKTVLLELIKKSKEKSTKAQVSRQLHALRPPMLDRLIVHQFDPSRPSPGGIDTCIRGLCRYVPANQTLGIVGVDTNPDLNRPLGVWSKFQFKDNTIWFMPVARLDPANQRRHLPHSLRLIAGLLRFRRNLPTTRVVQAHRMDTAWSLNKILALPLVYFVHTQGGGLTGATSDSIWKFAGKTHKSLEESVVRRAEQVVVFNEDYARDLRTHNNNTYFSPTWYDPEIIEADEVERDPYGVLWVGRVEEPKDPILAVAAFNQLCKLRPESPWRLHFAGDGTLMPQVNSSADTLTADISARIIRLGRVAPAQVAHLMATNRYFLMTSYKGYEGYPRVLVEAMASGMISIVTDGADTGSLVVDGSNGYTAPTRVPSEIAELIAKAGALRSSDARQAVAKLDARDVVQTIFNYSPVHMW